MRIQTKKRNSIRKISKFFCFYVSCVFCFSMSETIQAQEIIHNNVLYLKYKNKVICKGFWDKTVKCNKLILPDSIPVSGKNYPIFCIENDAFSNNKYLRYVRLPNTLQSIESYAFGICANLDSIYIPASVKNISESAFYYSNLISIRVAPQNPYFDSRDNSCAIINSKTNELIAGSANTIIPTSVVKLAEMSFSRRKKLKHITIPKNIKSIGRLCFYDCENLASVTFEDDSVAESQNAGLSIKDCVFGNCKVLKDISLPSRLNSIGDAAFAGCKKLSSLYIPGRVEFIGGYLFANSPSLKSVVVSSDNKYYDSRNQCNSIIETKSNNLLATCHTTVIPYDVRIIGECAFQHVDIDNIIIPDGVKSIGSYAFSSKDIHNITIPESVDKIDVSSFFNCNKLNIHLKHTSPPILTIDEDIIYSDFIDGITSDENVSKYAYLKKISFYVSKTVYEEYMKHPVWSKLNIRRY